MQILQLFISFFRIGLFTFGGGYAMVPLMQREMTAHNWMTVQQFGDIVAISQITPGPLAINAATYVGYLVSGFWGSAAATVGVALPSLLMIILLSQLLSRVWGHPLVRTVFYGLRPVVVALIGTATVFFAKASLFSPVTASEGSHVFLDWLSRFNPVALSLFGLTLLLDTKSKIHPILVILLCGLIAVVVFSCFPGVR